jgi:uncharacterized protein YndB with AHSA1/START domain
MSTTPDLSLKPFQLSVQRDMRAGAADLYDAWTRKFDTWFAAPGTLLMKVEIDVPFYFETKFDGQRHAHYGRFLRLDPDRLIELTWVTGEPGTRGSETVVTVEFEPLASGTRITLSHAGFPDKETCDGHGEAWPEALANLDRCTSELGN